MFGDGCKSISIATTIRRCLGWCSPTSARLTAWHPVGVFLGYLWGKGLSGRWLGGGNRGLCLAQWLSGLGGHWCGRLLAGAWRRGDGLRRWGCWFGFRHLGLVLCLWLVWLLFPRHRLRRTKLVADQPSGRFLSSRPQHWHLLVRREFLTAL